MKDFTGWTSLIPGKLAERGLGLAIARGAVVMHRGAIKVYSQLGEGTTFTIRIPLTYVR